MIDFLLGVPGKLKTLTDRLSSLWAAKVDTLHDTRITAARAGYLDKLNLAGNVVDDAMWTDARAGFLDGIIQTSVIASIQTGYVEVTATVSTGEDTYYTNVTITAVAAVNKCLVIVHPCDAGGALQMSTGRLTSTTNLRLATGNASTVRGRWYVIEFK